jgi:hypothetical protein
MLETIKVAMAGLVIYKGFKILGKKDYADIIGFVTLMSVGFSIYMKIGGWYIGITSRCDSIMNSGFVQLLEKLVG